jgi:hypothetical protein
MEALRASYGDSSSDSDTDDLSPASPVTANSGEKDSISLPPPPLALLDSIVSTGSLDFFSTEPGVRVRNFPHVDGNYALHVYVPGICSFRSLKFLRVSRFLNSEVVV